MDPNTGKLFSGVTDEQAAALGLIGVPADHESAVRAMTRLERRAWAAKQAGKPLVLTASDEERIAAAVVKRERKAARRIAEAKGTAS